MQSLEKKQLGENMNFYAVYKNEEGDEESLQIVDGVTFVFNTKYYGPSLEELKQFTKDKQIINSRGEPLTFSFLVEQVSHIQKNQTIAPLLYEQMVTGSSSDIYLDKETNTFFKWKKEL